MLGIKIGAKLFLVQFVTAIADRIPPTTVQALEFPSVDCQVFGFKMVVLANQRTLVASPVLGTFLVGRNQRFLFLH